MLFRSMVGVSDKEEALSVMEENKSMIQTVANDVIQNEGYNYGVDVSIDNVYFPIKQYGEYTFPSGMFDALRF